MDTPDPEAQARLCQYYGEVGRRVCRVMRSKRMSVDELALLCGVAPKHIRNLRMGVPEYVNGNIIGLAARALEVEKRDLWGNGPDFDA